MTAPEVAYAVKVRWSADEEWEWCMPSRSSVPRTGFWQTRELFLNRANADEVAQHWREEGEFEAVEAVVVTVRRRTKPTPDAIAKARLDALEEAKLAVISAGGFIPLVRFCAEAIDKLKGGAK